MMRTLAIVLLTGLELSASAQEPLRFRARTDLVSVDVLVCPKCPNSTWSFFLTRSSAR